MHPLFLLVGIWYAFKGELFLFLLSTLVALQHECAHAFAAAKLGYKLDAIVLMPFGAVIDGDLQGISLKDELFVAFCGPFCNLVTAGGFIALWWLFPTLYPFTDVVCQSSLAIALVNLLPAYPLDGGRMLKCLLVRAFARGELQERKAERRADLVYRGISLTFAVGFLVIFIVQCVLLRPNFTLLAFSLFLGFGAVGNRGKSAVYSRMDFALSPNLKRGVEIRKVALLDESPIKDVLRFLSKNSYLVLEVYDGAGEFLFELSQNDFSKVFTAAPSPYTSLRDAVQKVDYSTKKGRFSRQNGQKKG